MSPRSLSAPPPYEDTARLVAVLGPTNTGKTHLAVERMLGHDSGMIGLPLRLLAREIYDRIVRTRGAASAALITGEEKIVPPGARYFVGTVEAMPLDRDVSFLAVDEIQLLADPERGHVFTDRLLHARGRHETMFLGASAVAPLVRRLVPGAEIVTRERYSSLTSSGPRKVSRLPRRSAVVAFSAEAVYALAELIRRQRGGAAVVMGMLSPRTRNAQVALFQSGEVDFLVATDAIGMGLNMDVDHVAFAGLGKFDGRRRRPLSAHEVGQIAGRAGRFRNDGTFGATAACEPMSEDLIAAVEAHRFEAIPFAQWRNGDLDFSSLADLQAALAAPPPREGLRAAPEALDERALRDIAQGLTDEGRTLSRTEVRRLWDACQVPDFRKTTLDDHLRLVRALFGFLAGAQRGREGRVPDDWMAGLWRGLDRAEGDIDALSARLAGVRTLAYIAHRPDWLADPRHWREAARALEDRLSDALHERLMARFIDARTSALMRGLGRPGELLAGVAADGAVTVEGHLVGRLNGLSFEAEAGTGALARKALRAAAERAVGPQVTRRLGLLAAEGDEAFSLSPDALILWHGVAVGRLAGGDIVSPQVALLGELGPDQARARAARRLEAFVAAEARRLFPALTALGAAVAEGAVKGLARGIAWRLIEAGGVAARADLEADLAALSKTERRSLRALGVRIDRLALSLPDHRDPAARAMAGAFLARSEPAIADRAPRAAQVDSPARLLGLTGFAVAGGWRVAIEDLDRLDTLIGAAARRGQSLKLTPEVLTALGWSPAAARDVLAGLGWREAAGAWRPPASGRSRQEKTAPPAPPPGPFAALAVLATPRRSARSRAGRRRRRAHG